jgi:hypothetical protein
LIRRGYEVISLQQKRETKPFNDMKYSLEFPDIDALFIE